MGGIVSALSLVLMISVAVIPFLTYALPAAAGMLIVIARHRENIVRLINGTEPDFKPAKRPGTKRKEEC